MPAPGIEYFSIPLFRDNHFFKDDFNCKLVKYSRYLRPWHHNGNSYIYADQSIPNEPKSQLSSLIGQMCYLLVRTVYTLTVTVVSIIQLQWRYSPDCYMCPVWSESALYANIKSQFSYVMSYIMGTNKRIFERKIVYFFSSISFGCSKEPSHWDDSFEYPQHMFWLGNRNCFSHYSLLSRGLQNDHPIV